MALVLSVEGDLMQSSLHCIFWWDLSVCFSGRPFILLSVVCYGNDFMWYILTQVIVLL